MAAIIDPIADMLTRIRNGGKAKFASVDMPSSKIKLELARVLKEQGYVKNFKKVDDGKQGILRVYLKYTDGQKHVIYGIDRVSKPSCRTYAKTGEIKPVLNGLGIAILSTSKGILTDKQAKTENVGGEVLCNVW
ncbi:SSU ribosomal protein S8P [Desulfobotulus alkaliphilus]|uniref:Small ribosomal subunit protein uS8 n=1 Tax=Desulfobotulus alkaliphilus TaxID=622671 RepID=A0A562RTL0_9BACT|nr:30S ribosomal protein S8 [Desulfobotulus alkaliphilus]TWI71636.1 SSU ribosomal protein S8P [Desulfobotulus alkaliphilus]